MKNRINNSKGMTIVEVLVSVIIISLIMGVLFTLLLQVQKVNSDSSKRSSVLLAQNVITKAIERDMIEIGVKSISSCDFEHFGFNENVIDSYYDEDENIHYNYECIRIEYNQSYDMSDVGYLMVYKQSNTQDNPAWVMRYGRGYYNECEKGSVPLYTNWKETYSVVQKLDSNVDLKIIPSENEVAYSAKYESGKKYSEQKMNNGKLFVPIQDENGYNYNIDLSFTFRLYNTVKESVSDTNVNFTCDNSDPNRLECKCSGSVEDCAKTNVPANSQDENGRYLYRCSESKASLGSVIGMNKNFIELSGVVENNIYASKVESIEFLSLEDYSRKYLDPKKDDYKVRSSIDVSYSQNGTNLMYFEKDRETKMYKLFITQSGGVKVYGNSLSNMFKNFTNLKSINFLGLSTSGVTTMNSMFYNCTSLESLTNFNTLDFSTVTDMSSMFYRCRSLKTSPFNGADLSSVLYANSTFNESGLSGKFNYKHDFNARNVVSLRTFLRASSITGFLLDYENQEMPNLTNINSMLSYCLSLQKSEFKNTVAKQLTNMEFLYASTRYMTTAVFSNFIVEKVNSFYGLFDECNKLTSFTFENFDSSKVEYFSEMFKECKALVNINLDGLSYESAKYFTRMFYNCQNLQYVTFAEEGSTASTDSVVQLQEAFYNCKAFKGFKGKRMTFHGVGTGTDSPGDVSRMFALAGNGTGELDLSNMELYNCRKFSKMFEDTNYDGINLSGIHSQLTDGTIDLSQMFWNSNVHYVFLNDAEFKTAVNMYQMFRGSNLLTFVAGINYKNDDSLNSYFSGVGDLVKLNGKAPFDNFMAEGGYASDLSQAFYGCAYLRGIEDEYLAGITTNSKTTSYENMFYYAFSASILSSVTLSGDEYKKVYQIDIPFTFENGNILKSKLLTGCTNLAVIKLSNVKNVSSGRGYYLEQNQFFLHTGKSAFMDGRIDSLDVYIGDMQIDSWYGGKSEGYNQGLYYFFGVIGQTTVNNKPTRFTRSDGTDGVGVNLHLSSTCDIAKKQYNQVQSVLKTNTNNKANYIWPSGCSAG